MAAVLLPVLGAAPPALAIGHEALAVAPADHDVRPGPNIPEPMVFDLIRPLGVRKGELEVNVLGLKPLSRLSTSDEQFDFIGGSDDPTGRRDSLELAPEIEYGLFDNFAVELELPIAHGELAAVKGAAQYTFGGGRRPRFTHGVQSIVFHDLSSHSIASSLLYLAGYRFSPRWSTLAMLGANREFGGDNPGSRTLGILNATLFAEMAPRWTLGLETNYANTARGNASLLVMPQVHTRLSPRFSSQFGVGTQKREGSLAAELVFRLVAEL
ncbi:MAG: hypothetical protein C0434_08910 [Xanthomonadaceae bacterium]|nr:hypothetical protein [Xanthomonadaceae bacterium]